jgi:5'-methylthioadenosine phosphorylase
MEKRVEIAVIGGSGFYQLADGDIEFRKVETPYGAPSDTIGIAEIAGRTVAFLPRHGSTHSIPPHKVPYRANIWALHSLGVRRIIAPSAVGSLQPHIHPGDFVVNDQFVDRTSGRQDTYYDGPIATHISTAEPYCSQLRSLAINACRINNINVHDQGTCVVIQGPRFSTKAESRWFTSMGWHVVTMTQYPEVTLARELAMCYINLSMVTDYDAGLVSDTAHVETTDVLKMLGQNTANAKLVIQDILKTLPENRECTCGDALKFAKME